MDRRQKKTRGAIINAFTSLIEQKSYSSITVQEIIDKADIGRSTFYAHFETKDALLRELCEELFSHIINSTLDSSHTHGLYSNNTIPDSVFCHLLQHLAENHNNVLGLLSCESNGIFLRYFKTELNDLVRRQFITPKRNTSSIPEDFLVNHISSTFVEMVLWWIKGGRKETPQELERYFSAVIEPIV